MQTNLPLPEGSTVERYRIRGVIAAGGFSFVYLAQDAQGAPLALKEYLPAALPLRTGAGAAVKVPDALRASFVLGIRCFFEEARALAGVRHPNVVRVLDFCRANGTAYMAMRYERGRTLQRHIERCGGGLGEAWMRATFAELMRGLREVHSGKLLHLDLKPGNIYVREGGAPLLIDFGAARQVLAAARAGLPSMHTPGFSSPEHLGEPARLGPWSDIYSVGASMYACLGATPPPAAERQARDCLIPARKLGAGRYSEQLLDIIDWCLRLDPLARPQSVFALQKMLAGAQRLGAAPVTPTWLTGVVPRTAMA